MSSHCWHYGALTSEASDLNTFAQARKSVRKKSDLQSHLSAIIGKMMSVQIPLLNIGRVLVIDDAPAIRLLAKTVLTQAGLCVDLATNGKEALDCICRADHGIDVLVLDLTMPEMSGHQLIEELVKRNIRVPTILCSGSITQMDQVMAQSAGMVLSLIQKPFCIQSLKEIVLNALRHGSNPEQPLVA